MSDFSIRKGLQARLLSMPGAVTTAKENSKFDPVDGVAYQTAELVPLPPDNPTYGDNFYREKGFYRIRIHFPLQKGEGAASLYAQQLRDWFKRGSSISVDGIDVRILRTPLIGSGVIFNNRYTRTIDVEYFASIC